MNKIRLLPGMKFMLGGVLYSPEDILPDTADTRGLVRQKKAEYIDGTNVGKASSPPSEQEDYEAQSAKNLTLLAKERGIDIPRGTNKAGLIELLKAWDAEHAGGGGDEGAS